MSAQENQLQLLADLSVGQKALIVAFSVDTAAGEKVQEAGLSPGEQLEIMRSPAEGPIEIKIRGYFVSLSRPQAAHIKVKVL